jgi:hypothetical protein
MNAAEFIQSSVRGLHEALLADMTNLSQEHLGWSPQPGANPIGYIFLHYMRTEDGQIHRMQGQPSLWDAAGWYQRLGLTQSLNEGEIDNAARAPLADSLAYAQHVMDGTRRFLATLDDAKLDVAPDPDRPRRTIGLSLRAFILAHGWWHLGEIKYLKGLQGMPQ